MNNLTNNDIIVIEKLLRDIAPRWLHKKIVAQIKKPTLPVKIEHIVAWEEAERREKRINKQVRFRTLKWQWDQKYIKEVASLNGNIEAIIKLTVQDALDWDTFKKQYWRE